MDGGSDYDFDPVLSAFQIWFDIGTETGKHVFGKTGSLSVDPDFRKRINRIDVEKDGFLLEKIFIELEISGISPVVITYPLNQFFIASDIGIGNYSGFKQSGIVVAGHLSGNWLKSRFAG